MYVFYSFFLIAAEYISNTYNFVLIFCRILINHYDTRKLQFRTSAEVKFRYYFRITETLNWGHIRSNINLVRGGDF